MQQFEASERMPAVKEIVFDEITRPDLLARWLPEQVQVRSTGEAPLGGDAHEPGDPAPDEVREGSLDVDPGLCRVQWAGGAGADQYAGFIQVCDSGTGASEVTVHLRLPDSVVPERADIDATLRASLQDLYLTVSKRVTSP